MGRLVTWVVLVAACGKVGEAPATVADAALDAFSCSGDMLTCGGSCVDGMSDPMNCGGCGVACQSVGESCQAGTCMDTLMSCADVIASNPNALDGTYTFVNNTKANCDFSGTTSCSTIRTKNSRSLDGFYPLAAGSGIWCDMTDGGFNIYGLAYGEVGATIANYHQLSLFDYQSADLEQAFIAMFNQQGNIPLAATWTLSNCCIKFDSSTAFLNLGSNNGTDSYSLIETCATMPNPTISFSTWVSAASEPTQQAPLPADFFTTFPATGVVSPACVANANPALYWKETP